jgi:hypothetical protein
MQKLLNWYRSILNNASLHADDTGAVSVVLEDGEVPYLVDKKRLVLPTRENMARDKDSIVLFNPLSENILEGESPVMARYRHSINTVVNWRLNNILDDLFQIAGSPGESNNQSRPLSPDQLSILRHVREVDAKMYANWQALTKAMPLGDTQKCIVHIYVKKQALIHGKSYRRAAIISFPLFEALVEASKGKDRKVFGVQLRKSDIECLINTLKIVLPNLDEPGAYNRGSTSDSQPTIHALLLGLLGLAANVNAIVELFSSVRPEMKKNLYDTEWVEVLNDLSQLDADLLMVPHQAGNSGTVDRLDAARPASPSLNPNTAPPVLGNQPQAQSHVGSNPNIVYYPDGTINAQATNAKMSQPQPQPGYGYPPVAYGQPPAIPPGFGFGNMGFQPQPMSGPMAARSMNVPAYELMNYGTPTPTYQPPGYQGYAPPGYGNQGYGAPYGTPRV